LFDTVQNHVHPEVAMKDAWAQFANYVIWQKTFDAKLQVRYACGHVSLDLQAVV
jgi:hypothetical protein